MVISHNSLLLSALASASASALLPPQRVAVVTGASRGIGRGIAVELGRTGMVVFCLGRSSRSGVQSSELPGERAVGEGLDLTVESAAEQVTAAGGRGCALRCDCASDDAIAAALASIREAEGRLDVLVCSAYSTPPGALRDDFWKQGMDMWDAVNGVGLRSV